MPFHWLKGVARSVSWDPGNVKKSRDLKEMFSCKAKFKVVCGELDLRYAAD